MFLKEEHKNSKADINFETSIFRLTFAKSDEAWFMAAALLLATFLTFWAQI